MVEERSRIFFPFTAIVGQEKAKLALTCTAVDPTIGGVLLSGEKGTGKSSMVRALSQVLPEIEVVEGCPFNCNPANQLEMCSSCRQTIHEKGALKAVKRRMRVVDMPLSITLDRLVGTIDIKRALTEGVRAFQPGLLAEANRNILYIDEVNLLEDYVADVLLDAAAMGWNIVEREGVSVAHPARFILVGSMNPEEGELRPQLLDRFGLYVAIEPVKDPEQRIEIVRRVEEFQRDPESFYMKYEAEEARLRESIVRARQLLPQVEVDEDLLKILIETIIKFGIGTHRAEITTVKTAKAIAALDGRSRVRLEDLEKAMELTLPHRLKSKPFEAAKTEPPTIRPAINSHSDGGGRDGSQRSKMPPPETSGLKSDLKENAPGSLEKRFEASDVEVDLKRTFLEGESSGKLEERGSRDCKTTSIGHPHGYPLTYTLPTRPEQLCDIHLTASINASAVRRRKLPLTIEEDDMRVNVRKRRLPKLSVIVLDSSGSMGILRRMSVAKGIAQKLVENSYKKRDLVAMIAFRGSGAEVVVPPTRNYTSVLEALNRLPTGGRTPLPSALHQLLFLAEEFSAKNKQSVIQGILISDGKGNVPLHNNVGEDVEVLALQLAKKRVKIEIHDTSPKASISFAPSYINLVAELTKAQVFRYD